MQRQVKNAVRCERRAAAEALAGKAEIAAAKGDTRELFRLTRKMAPPQRLPTQTVRQCCPKTGALGERCWTQDEELDARTHALEYIFEGTAGESPEITVDDPKDQIPEATEIPVGPFAAADVVRAVKGLPNYKAGPNIVKNEGERLASGATAEVWKFYLPVITTFCVKVWNASWQMKEVSPALKTSEIAFLGKAKKDAADPVNGWRTISLQAHGGKAIMRCIWRQILPKVAPKISEAQFGGVPGKGTREAVLVATENIARFHKATKGSGKSCSPQMYLAAVLFELEKAFDKVDRTTAFAALTAKAQTAGLDMYLEEMHTGTHYKIRDRSGQIQRQVSISRGVRQGSVEGPLIFVACYDLVLHGIQERREAAELSSISARSRATRSGEELEVPVNEIAFVDDLQSFLMFKSWEHLTGMDPSSHRGF